MIGGSKIMILKLVIGLIIGGGAGFAFYKFIGCTTGTCPLTSNPWVSTFYGMILGGLIAGSLK